MTRNQAIVDVSGGGLVSVLYIKELEAQWQAEMEAEMEVGNVQE